MGSGARLWLCVLLAFAIVFTSSARVNRVSFSGNEMVLVSGRSLKMSLDDYGEPSANRGHDPPRGRAAGGSGGRRGR